MQTQINTAHIDLLLDRDSILNCTHMREQIHRTPNMLISLIDELVGYLILYRMWNVRRIISAMKSNEWKMGEDIIQQLVTNPL